MKLFDLIRSTMQKLRSSRLSSDERGAVMSEYVVLVGVVGLGVATAIAALGPVLLASYERARGIILCPLP
jgi:Flp pilus assembly pilin Flp